MTLKKKVLFHQIHPAKLAVDITGGLLSTGLMWVQRLGIALIAGLLPSIVTTVVMVRTMDFEAQRASVAGRYIARNMTPTAQAVRLGGQCAVWLAAWRHLPLGIGAGCLLIALGWGWALPFASRRQRTGLEAKAGTRTRA